MSLLQKHFKDKTTSYSIVAGIKIGVIVIALLAISVTLSQIGIFGNLAWAAAVELLPINSGNATLDQGLPIFYDCIEEAVDESFSEQEPNYFKEEPTKAEVVGCYYEVFANNNIDSDTESNDDNNKEIEEDD